MRKFIFLASLMLAQFGFQSFAVADGSVRIFTIPEDADVLVDGELKAVNTPVSILLPDGRYQIEGRRNGKSRTADVLITEGVTVLKEFEFGEAISEAAVKPDVPVVAAGEVNKASDATKSAKVARADKGRGIRD